jgi:hypothetical protein
MVSLYLYFSNVLDSVSIEYIRTFQREKTVHASDRTATVIGWQS